MLNVDKVFVLHVKRGYEDREQFIIEQFKRVDIDFEFILDGDVDDLTQEIKSTYFTGQMQNNEISMSVTMKHIYAHQKLIEGQHRNALIFEDDVILDKYFTQVFNRCMDEVAAISDDACIYFSNACNMYVPFSKLKKGKQLYKMDRSRAADSYFISRRVAQKRLDFIDKNKCAYISDIFFNHMDPKINVVPYWCHPTIVEQGSMNGRFESSLNQKRKGSFLRKFDWNIQKIYKKSFRRLLK